MPIKVGKVILQIVNSSSGVGQQHSPEMQQNLYVDGMDQHLPIFATDLSISRDK